MDITIDFLKMSPVFTYYSTQYPNIPLEDDQMICFSRLWTIVCKALGFMFLIPFSFNLSADKYTSTFDTHNASVMAYLYNIVFDPDTVFILDYFMDWAVRKGIKLKLSTIYHLETGGKSEIANKAILQATRACKMAGNEWLHKLYGIQLLLNTRDNNLRQNSLFLLLLAFEAKLAPSSFPYQITSYTITEERHLDTSRNLYSSKGKVAKQANKKRTVPPLPSTG